MRIPMKPMLPIQDPHVIAGLRSKAHEKLFSGPRDCIKTSSVLAYALSRHEAYPNFQSEILRHEYKQMGAVYDTLNTNILRYALGDPRNPFEFKSSSKSEPRPHILFNNGGKMVFGGMDNSEKALGSEMDLVIYSQGEQEKRMKHISDILGCMGGRAGNWIRKDGSLHHCLIIDANPDHKKHILMQRVESGAMEWTKFTHKTHPLYYDWNSLEYTQRGLSTIEWLKGAYPEGYLRDRMVYGRWTNPTGMVYPQFKESVHNIPIARDDIALDATWHLSCDYGKINAVGIYARSGNKTILFKEIYRKGVAVPHICEMINALKATYTIPDFTSGVGDHEFNGKQIMIDAGLPIKPANKKVSVKDGIELVRKKLINEELILNKNSLDEPDPQLIGGIHRTSDELVSLHYKDEGKQTGSSRDDLPDPECPDHGADHVRYEVVDSTNSEVFNWTSRITHKRAA